LATGTSSANHHTEGGGELGSAGGLAQYGLSSSSQTSVHICIGAVIHRLQERADWYGTNIQTRVRTGRLFMKG
jgi:hypothetical protein